MSALSSPQGSVRRMTFFNLAKRPPLTTTARGDESSRRERTARNEPFSGETRAENCGKNVYNPVCMRRCRIYEPPPPPQPPPARGGGSTDPDVTRDQIHYATPALSFARSYDEDTNTSQQRTHLMLSSISTAFLEHGHTGRYTTEVRTFPPNARETKQPTLDASCGPRLRARSLRARSSRPPPPIHETLNELRPRSRSLRPYLLSPRRAFKDDRDAAAPSVRAAAPTRGRLLVALRLLNTQYALILMHVTGTRHKSATAHPLPPPQALCRDFGKFRKILMGLSWPAGGGVRGPNVAQREQIAQTEAHTRGPIAHPRARYLL
ncbi:hypothetical protein EVAR_40960_1 [Eumeta japonica]|uniref:Uncharacterized protein n=1 Tax=Eumeta variegata TaxID=151549 RepID=A0A4C1X5G3_EUMVA|nr:hypothetical protein EVAR_40960_1 [Eumeta japonica]